MTAMRMFRNDRGMTLVEIMVAAGLMIGGLAAVMSTFSSGYYGVAAGGGQSRATALAQSQIEFLKNQPFAALANGNDSPEAPDLTTTRQWTIAVAGAAPNRTATITVTVTWKVGSPASQTVTLVTTRGEWG